MQDLDQLMHLVFDAKKGKNDMGGCWKSVIISRNVHPVAVGNAPLALKSPQPASPGRTGRPWAQILTSYSVSKSDQPPLARLQEIPSLVL